MRAVIKEMQTVGKEAVVTTVCSVELKDGKVVFVPNEGSPGYVKELEDRLSAGIYDVSKPPKERELVTPASPEKFLRMLPRFLWGQAFWAELEKGT
jgi:hypothetical protein